MLKYIVLFVLRLLLVVLGVVFSALRFVWDVKAGWYFFSLRKSKFSPHFYTRYRVIIGLGTYRIEKNHYKTPFHYIVGITCNPGESAPKNNSPKKALFNQV